MRINYINYNKQIQKYKVYKISLITDFKGILFFENFLIFKNKYYEVQNILINTSIIPLQYLNILSTRTVQCC